MNKELSRKWEEGCQGFAGESPLERSESEGGFVSCLPAVARP